MVEQRRGRLLVVVAVTFAEAERVGALIREVKELLAGRLLAAPDAEFVGSEELEQAARLSTARSDSVVLCLVSQRWIEGKEDRFARIRAALGAWRELMPIFQLQLGGGDRLRALRYPGEVNATLGALATDGDRKILDDFVATLAGRFAPPLRSGGLAAGDAVAPSAADIPLFDPPVQPDEVGHFVRAPSREFARPSDLPARPMLARKRAVDPRLQSLPPSEFPRTPSAVPVDAAVFSPVQVAAGEIFLVQIWLYQPQSASAARRLAKETDPEASRRATFAIPVDVPEGARLDVR
ncbi:MAG: hypothetical protein ACJ8H8_00560, partial [Geminicoccaceae bacterium]